MWINHCVHPPPPLFCCGRRRGLNLLPHFTKGQGLDSTSTLRGGCWKRGGNLFQGGLPFYKKNKRKSEIFNDKKCL